MLQDIQLDSLNYYPALRTRRAELAGLKNLDLERKRKIIPLITVGEWPRAADFERSVTEACDAMEALPFIIDITTEQDRLPQQRLQLIDSHNGFQNWVDFSNQYTNVIPTVIFTSGARTRDIIQQAIKIESNKGKVSFRIKDFPTETPLVIAALSALDDPTNAIIFIDCQYIRSALAAYVTAAISTINAIRREFPESIICILSTSFPSSTIPFLGPLGRSGSVDIQELDLFSRVGGRAVAIYGDHSSIHSVVYDDPAMRRWSPRIDLPTYDTWFMERRTGLDAQTGYIDAAQSILLHAPDIATSNIWGERMINDAANGNPYGKAPASWIAVRVNIHLSKQIDLAYSTHTPRRDDEDTMSLDDEEF